MKRLVLLLVLAGCAEEPLAEADAGSDVGAGVPFGVETGDPPGADPGDSSPAEAGLPSGGRPRMDVAPRPGPPPASAATAPGADIQARIAAGERVIELDEGDWVGDIVIPDEWDGVIRGVGGWFNTRIRGASSRPGGAATPSRG